MKQRGFTLIEFLVVAALLGIMMTIGMSTYQRSLSRGRDAKRVEDMGQIQKGFELHYTLEGSYDSVTDCSTIFNDTRVFPKGQPEPPAGGKVYFGSCAADTYAYCAELENGEDYGNLACDTLTINSGGVCVSSTSDINSYCVYSVQ